MQITPVILSGGGGTRLWPMSTPQKPKQFLALTEAQTMFELTVARVSDRVQFASPIIVANAAHHALVKEQLEAAGARDATILLEPCARNTAPAIAIAALAANNPEAVLLVMPSDHLIADVDAFHAAIQSALPLVSEGWLVTFGITPDQPETGYGYIRIGEALSGGVHKVARFVEKPNLETAKAMLAEGNHAWNGGIFLFRADAYCAALAQHAPGILEAAKVAMDEAIREGNSISPAADAFAASPSDSIDYAVMEKADKVAVVPVSMGWSDIGSWDALYDIGTKDAAGNSILGDARMIDASGNLIRSDGIRINAAGVENMIIVASGNEILIVPRGKSQDVKKFSG
ncbi:MAG: mannose-1-phosphate guanylyltransferase/mannose-6-phosphate isomerase [Sphingomonadales bacterium]|nr:mannose-1-phosphate guanylyltransferase/mannose-6-phosphate isomerase [Sphingomonadales bacterium]